MKKVLFLIVLACLAVPVQATVYEITSGYDPGLTLQNSDSLLMTGGGIGLLTLEIESTATIEGTSVLQQGSGGIWEARLGYSSTFNMSGGQVHEINISNDATAILSGGLIEEIWSYQVAWEWDYGVDPPEWVSNPHITVVYSGDLPTVDVSNVLTGLWGGGDPFSIQLHDVTGYSPVIENIQFELIPEPATLLLFGLGGFLANLYRRPARL